MSLLSGGLSLVRFKIKHKISVEEVVKGLNSFKAHEALTYEKSENFGWAVIDNFLETHFKTSKIDFNDFYLFSVRHTFKKVPSSLLKAYCLQEEQKRLVATKKEALTRFEKSEIRNEIRARLFEEQPIEYKVYDCMLEIKSGVLYFSGTSKKIKEEFIKLFELSFDVTPLFLDASGLASQILKQVDFKALKQKLPSLYTPIKTAENKEIELENFLGGDFLTWLWYQIEEKQKEFTVEEQKVGILLDDFLVLRNPINSSMDALENTFKNGIPSSCSEAAAALYSGKKLYQAKVEVATKEAVWAFKFFSEKFSLNGIRLPALDPDSELDALEERLEKIGELFLILDTVFVLFLEDYLGDEWGAVEASIRKWVKVKWEDAFKIK